MSGYFLKRHLPEINTNFWASQLWAPQLCDQQGLMHSCWARTNITPGIHACPFRSCENANGKHERFHQIPYPGSDPRYLNFLHIPPFVDEEIRNFSTSSSEASAAMEACLQRLHIAAFASDDNHTSHDWAQTYQISKWVGGMAKPPCQLIFVSMTFQNKLP